MDLELASKKALKALNDTFGDIGFEKKYLRNGEVLELCIENVKLSGHDDNIRVSLELTTGKMAFFSFAFDYIEMNLQTLELINKFNAENPFFKAYIHKNGFLSLESNYAVYSEEEFANQCVQYMLRGNDLTDDKNLLALTKFTFKEEKKPN